MAVSFRPVLDLGGAGNCRTQQGLRSRCATGCFCACPLGFSRCAAPAEAVPPPGRGVRRITAACAISAAPPHQRAEPVHPKGQAGIENQHRLLPATERTTGISAKTSIWNGSTCGDWSNYAAGCRLHLLLLPDPAGFSRGSAMRPRRMTLH